MADLMSYWTLDESVALLLGLNPNYTSWALIKQFLDAPDTFQSFQPSQVIIFEFLITFKVKLTYN